MKTLQELAAEVSKMFFLKDMGEKRGTVYLTKEDAAEWVKDMCRDAHGDMLPDDYKYNFIVEALNALAENQDLEDIQLEPDVYTHDLLQWLASRIDRLYYVDQAREEGFFDAKTNTEAQISWGQYLEKQEVLGIVTDCLSRALVEHLQEGAQE